MTQVVPYDGHVNAGLQQGHRAAVAQDMRGDAASAQSGVLLCRLCGVFRHDVGDPVPRQRSPVAISKDQRLRSLLG